MIIRYVKDMCEEKQKEHAYRVYVTDALKIITENTAKYAGGSHLEMRYIDLLEDKKPEKQKTPEEIIAEVTKKAGLEVIY